MKKGIIIVSLILMLLLSACSSSGKSGAIDNETKIVSGWEIAVKSFAMASDLSNSQITMQYDGEALEVKFNEKPSTGKAFGLMDIEISKTQNAKNAFDWSNTYIEDDKGNKFSRHENDKFLTNYNLKRIKSIDLTFGVNSGIACYEIDESSSKSKLFFVYDDGSNSSKIRIK